MLTSNQHDVTNHLISRTVVVAHPYRLDLVRPASKNAILDLASLLRSFLHSQSHYQRGEQAREDLGRRYHSLRGDLLHPGPITVEISKTSARHSGLPVNLSREYRPFSRLYASLSQSHAEATTHRFTACT